MSVSAVAVDLVEAPQVPGQRVRLAFDALAAQILEQIVVRVDAVERRVRGMRLVEITEQVVDEMRERFGNDHGKRSTIVASGPAGRAVTLRSANGTIKPLVRCPARSSWSRRRSATSKTSPRARCAFLREVSVIAAEDTRRTAHLLARYAITTPTTSLHEHNEAAKARSLIERLERGEHIALVSDAGTPTVSDPGRTPRPGGD